MSKHLVKVVALGTLIFLLTPVALATFSDVNNSNPNYDAIIYAQTNSIVSGYPDGTFKSSNTINRAEFTKIVVGAGLNYNPAQDPSDFDIYSTYYIPFIDAVADAWYNPYLRKAISTGMVSGYPDGTFQPGRDISFVEAAKIIVKGFSYSTSADPIWYKPYVNILADHKAIPSSILSFDTKITRGQMVEIIYRLKAKITTKPSLTYDILKAMPSVPPSMPTPQPSPNPQPAGNSPMIGSCPIFPADNPWNRDVSHDPIDPNSANYITSIGAGGFLHPDFGGNGEYGIPYTTVDAGQALVPINFTDYADESDPGPYPIPVNAPVEGGSDAHVLVVDKGNCTLYEIGNAQYVGPGWNASGGAKFDLTSNALRPDTWTSADAAGLPIFAGLVRYDEVAAGAINHALRFTVRNTQKGFIHPATHYASSSTDPNRPPMGLRLRLKANFDTSKFTGESKVILEALKKYGMIVADNGSNWYITGAADPRWNDDDLNQLKTVSGSAFEVVSSGPIIK